MKRKLIYALAVITTAVYIIWRIGWTLPFGYGALDMIFAILLLTAELVGFLEAVNYLSGMTDKKKIERPDIPKELYPDVDVFIATYNEETELLRKTINGCIHMDYPDKNKVHIYICDDNDRKEMAELAQSMGVGYFRRDTHKGAKAGNLNHALSGSSSPLVATFDADMIPMHDFLMAVIPYFFLDRYEKGKDGIWAKRKEPGDKIGFVQTPQSFYNADLFQYNLFSEASVPNEQDFFFQSIQCGRNKANAAIYAGSNTVLSREALEAAGGFYEEAITEDLATGLCIQTSGYQTLALGEVHANGLAPTDIRSLFKQRDRWARGCIQTFRQLHLFTRKGMTFKQRSAYISSLLYWYTPLRRIIFLLAPILFSVFGIYLLDCTFQEILIIWLPHYLCYTLALSSLSGRQRTVRLSNIYDTIMAFELIPGVILESFGIKKEKFEVTKKNTQTDEESFGERLRIASWHLVLIAFSVIGIINSVKMTLAHGTSGYIIILFWLITNLYNLCMAVFFIMGRKHFRRTERFSTAVPAVITAGNQVFQVVTKDISEGGLAFDMERPVYIPDGPLKLSVSDEEKRRRADLTGHIAHVEKIKNTWRYSIAFDEISDQEQLKLYQIVYDRVPTLPQAVSHRSGFFEDLKNNILKRKKPIRTSNRKLPRTEVKRKLQTDQGGTVWLMDFNYSHVLLKNKNGVYEQNWKLFDKNHKEISFECRLEKVVHKKRKHQKEPEALGLYCLENEKEFMGNKEFEQMISEWETEAGLWKEKVRRKQRERQNSSPYEFKEEKYL